VERKNRVQSVERNNMTRKEIRVERGKEERKWKGKIEFNQ
jgi:hypothetical protein